jgi:hypothetical protein
MMKKKNQTEKKKHQRSTKLKKGKRHEDRDILLNFFALLWIGLDW